MSTHDTYLANIGKQCIAVERNGRRRPGTITNFIPISDIATESGRALYEVRPDDDTALRIHFPTDMIEFPNPL